MGYTQVALEDKILEMYPELRQNNLTPRMSFDAEKNSWVVKLMKDGKTETVYISKADADGCMDNTFCEALKTDLCDVVKKFGKHK